MSIFSRKSLPGSYKEARVRAQRIVANLSEDEKWALKQELSGGRFYGGRGTIHSTTQLDVETHQGTVVAVWFRCQMLPFHQAEVDGSRATEMETAGYRLEGNQMVMALPGILGIDIDQTLPGVTVG